MASSVRDAFLNNVALNVGWSRLLETVICKTAALFLFLLVIFLFVGCAVTIPSKTTLRFENFKSERDFLDFFEKHYPSGTSEKMLIEVLNEAGAKCFEKEINRPTSKGLEGLPPYVQAQLKELYKKEPYKITCTYNQTLTVSSVYKSWKVEMLFGIDGKYLRSTAHTVVNAL